MFGLRILLIGTALLCAGTTFAYADAFTPGLLQNVHAEGHSQFMTGVRGTCDRQSHIARGPVGADISKNQDPFACDAAVLIFFDKQNRHVMVNFAQKSSTKEIIAFSGLMEADGAVMQVDKVYFKPGNPTYVDDGACKFFFKNRHMTGIFCGGKIDADGQRTVASIVFNPEPGQ